MLYDGRIHHSFPKFTNEIFLNPIDNLPQEEQNRIKRLRKIAGYSGEAFKTKFGDDFDMRFTQGCGTFENYASQGLTIHALSKIVLTGDEAEKENAAKELEQYGNIMVRVGGWQAPFVSMNLGQQQNYIDRFIGKLEY